MLSKLNELTLETELQTIMTNNVVWTKVKTRQQQNKKNPYISVLKPGIEPGTCGIAF